MSMRRYARNAYCIVSVLLTLGPLSGPAVPEEPAQAETPQNAPLKTPALDEFRILIDRNIFDAGRGTSSGLAGQEESTAPPKTLRLMGTWLEGDCALALFEAIPEGDQTSLECGGSIAGYAVADIGAHQVMLRNDRGTLELPVGAGLVKEENGNWMVVDPVIPVEPPVPSANNEAGTPPKAQSTAQSTSPPGNTGSEDPSLIRRRHSRKERE